jgi:hypothetical protein
MQIPIRMDANLKSVWQSVAEHLWGKPFGFPKHWAMLIGLLKVLVNRCRFPGQWVLLPGGGGDSQETNIIVNSTQEKDHVQSGGGLFHNAGSNYC